MSKKPTIQLYYQTSIIDSKTGKIIKKGRRKASKSLILQFLKHLEVLINHGYSSTGAVVSIADSGGTARNIQGSSSAFRYCSVLGSSSDINHGIMVGTGTSAVNNTNYFLDARIAHGTGSGQLEYGSSSCVPATIVGNNVELILYRTFVNSSGASINVKEIGISCTSMDTVNSERLFCLARDLVDDTINHGQIYAVTYTFITTA
jgi:hypothetical protein